MLKLTTVSGAGLAADARVAAAGTIDVAGSKTPSAAIRLTVKSAPAGGDWAAAVVAGPAAVKFVETDLRKLTLGFMASVSTLQPITFRIESVDAAGSTTGAAVGEFYPAAPDFYQRYAVEIGSLKTDGPKETPVLTSTGWSVIRIGLGSKEAPSDAPGIAYVEVRGLRVRGTNRTDADGNPVSPHAELLGKAVAETNGNGILVEARHSKNAVHHLRFADNVVERCAGVGVGVIFSDWLYYENNVINDKSWFTVYATSGFSILLGSSFDGTEGGYRFLVSGNRSFGNRCYQKWTASSNGDAPKRLSDGNGIIIDTLGGSAVQSTKSSRRSTGGRWWSTTSVRRERADPARRHRRPLDREPSVGASQP